MANDTDRFRGLLEEHRERLQNVIEHHDIGGSSLSEETGELSQGTDNHLADTASETYERELDEGLEEDARDQLREVESALERIDAGEYGRCEVDGKEIPEERLEAVPWTTLCVEHARARGR